jgi:hypothetical protein
MPPNLTAEPQECRARNELASVWMKRGIALSTKGCRASLRESTNCFDQAIALRRTLPLQANPWYSYGLIAGWMNRADTLTRLGSPEDLTEALRSYDEALLQLRTLPLNENPLFRRRLAIAWLNRGITLQEMGTEDCFAQAVSSFDAGIAALQNENASAIPDRDQLLASAWMNRGNALLCFRTPDLLSARAAAKEALLLIAGSEGTESIAAEVGFKARHVLCRALAELLARNESKTTTDGWLAEATDVVDDGMKWARTWELRGVDRFRALSIDLFRFGARVYQVYQPHFLAEFLSETLSPDEYPATLASNPDIHAVAHDALWRTLAEIQHTDFKDWNTQRFQALLDSFRELRTTGDRLKERRRQAIGPTATAEAQTAAR